MKTRITLQKIGEYYYLMDQPEGFTKPSNDFMTQYNIACDLINLLIAEFNKSWPNEVEGDEDYERAYFAMFLEKGLNSENNRSRIYEFTDYDGEDLEYHLRT